MKVTGYELKEALKMAGLALSTVQSMFDESLYKFDDEKKETPEQVVDRIQDLERKIAKLQTTQSQYNISVQVKVRDEEMTLEEAIKLVGGAGRISKMWRTAASGAKRSSWDDGYSKTRKMDEETAQRTIDKPEALKLAQKAESLASALRSAIAVGNTNAVELEQLTEDLMGV